MKFQVNSNCLRSATSCERKVVTGILGGMFRFSLFFRFILIIRITKGVYNYAETAEKVYKNRVGALFCGIVVYNSAGLDGFDHS